MTCCATRRNSSKWHKRFSICSMVRFGVAIILFRLTMKSCEKSLRKSVARHQSLHQSSTCILCCRKRLANELAIWSWHHSVAILVWAKRSIARSTTVEWHLKCSRTVVCNCFWRSIVAWIWRQLLCDRNGVASRRAAVPLSNDNNHNEPNALRQCHWPTQTPTNNQHHKQRPNLHRNLRHPKWTARTHCQRVLSMRCTTRSHHQNKFGLRMTAAPMLACRDKFNRRNGSTSRCWLPPFVPFLKAKSISPHAKLSKCAKHIGEEKWNH